MGDDDGRRANDYGSRPRFNLSRAENTSTLGYSTSPTLPHSTSPPYFQSVSPFLGDTRRTMTTPTDGSEDVNDFLLRIRELGERRDKEDDDRTKKLEDEILQGRKERQARRAGTFSPFCSRARHPWASLGLPALPWRREPRWDGWLMTC